jgi:CRISPR/Cas system-associated exonuclease Cas4 (RecB family)
MLGDAPVEVKSTRAFNRGEVPSHYLRQCAYYCVLTGKNSCTLITQHIIEGCFLFQKLTFSPHELQLYERQLVENRCLLEEALTKRDCSRLPTGESWQCKSCEYREDCDGHKQHNEKSV